MFLIPDIIGPEEENCVYTDMGQFVTSAHNFKSESTASLDKQMKAEQKRAEKLTTDLKDDLMEYMRL